MNILDLQNEFTVCDAAAKSAGFSPKLLRRDTNWSRIFPDPKVPPMKMEKYEVFMNLLTDAIKNREINPVAARIPGLLDSYILKKEDIISFYKNHLPEINDAFFNPEPEKPEIADILINPTPELATLPADNSKDKPKKERGEVPADVYRNLGKANNDYSKYKNCLTSETQKVAFALFYEYERSKADIARQMYVAPQTVEDTLKRAARNILNKIPDFKHIYNTRPASTKTAHDLIKSIR